MVEGNEISNPKKKGVFKAVDRLVISKDTWPIPRKFSLSNIFNRDSKHWMDEGGEYLAKKASAEVKKFLNKKVLFKIAVRKDNKWIARNQAIQMESKLLSAYYYLI